jgi:hypothetical protein
MWGRGPAQRKQIFNILTTLNVKLLAASALFVQSGALFIFYQLFCNCPI